MKKLVKGVFEVLLTGVFVYLAICATAMIFAIAHSQTIDKYIAMEEINELEYK